MSNEDCFHLGVKALIQNREKKLLLLQSRPKKIEVDGKAYWDIPGGRVQKNESLEEALKREIYEETGLQNISNIKHFTMVLSSIRIPVQSENVGLIFTTFLCEMLEDSPVWLSKEHKDFGWFEPIKAAELLTMGNFPLELTQKIVKLDLKEYSSK